MAQHGDVHGMCFPRFPLRHAAPRRVEHCAMHVHGAEPNRIPQHGELSTCMAQTHLGRVW